MDNLCWHNGGIDAGVLVFTDRDVGFVLQSQYAVWRAGTDRQAAGARDVTCVSGSCCSSSSSEAASSGRWRWRVVRASLSSSSTHRHGSVTSSARRQQTHSIDELCSLVILSHNGHGRLYATIQTSMNTTHRRRLQFLYELILSQTLYGIHKRRWKIMDRISWLSSGLVV